MQPSTDQLQQVMTPVALDMAPIRVLFVHRWGVIMAGGEVWIRNLASHLRNLGAQITAALHVRGPLYVALSDLQITTEPVRLDYVRAGHPKELLTSSVGVLESARQLWRLARNSGSQVLHAFSAESAEVAFLAARMGRLPLVVTVMNCGPYPKLDAHIFRHADRVIAASRAVERDLLDLGVPPERIIHITLGINFDELPSTGTGQLREELGIDRATPLIGLAATLERKKAQDVMLRAFPLILEQFPNARLVFLGADHESSAEGYGSYEAELRTLAATLGISQQVHFAGFRKNAPVLIAEFDVSVLCSRKEALGLAAVESLALGVPMVGTAVEGLQEVIEDGITGLLVPPDNPEALAHAINRLLSDRSFASALGKQGRQRVRARFDAARLAQENRAVYEAVLRGD